MADSLAERHRLIAQAMGVPLASIKTEHMLTRAAREGAGEPRRL